MKRVIIASQAIEDDVQKKIRSVFESASKILNAASTSQDIKQISNAVKKAFANSGGKVYVRVESPTYLQYDGTVGDYTIGGSISIKSSPKGDLNRLAEDLTMAAYRNMGYKDYTTPKLMRAVGIKSSTIIAGKYRPNFKYRQIFRKYSPEQVKFVQECYDEVCQDISNSFIHEDDPDYESYQPYGESAIKQEYLADAVESGLLTEEQFNELYSACEEQGTEQAMSVS